MGRMRDTAATQVVPHLLGKLIRLVADPLNTVRRSHRLAHEIALIPLVAETVEHLHAHFIVRPRQIDVVNFLTIEEILIVGVVGGNIRERCLNIRIVGGDLRSRVHHPSRDCRRDEYRATAGSQCRWGRSRS